MVLKDPSERSIWYVGVKEKNLRVRPPVVGSAWVYVTVLVRKPPCVQGGIRTCVPLLYLTWAGSLTRDVSSPWSGTLSRTLSRVSHLFLPGIPPGAGEWPLRLEPPGEPARQVVRDELAEVDDAHAAEPVALLEDLLELLEPEQREGLEVRQELVVLLQDTGQEAGHEPREEASGTPAGSGRDWGRAGRITGEWFRSRGGDE